MAASGVVFSGCPCRKGVALGAVSGVCSMRQLGDGEGSILPCSILGRGGRTGAKSKLGIRKGWKKSEKSKFWKTAGKERLLHFFVAYVALRFCGWKKHGKTSQSSETGGDELLSRGDFKLWFKRMLFVIIVSSMFGSRHVFSGEIFVRLDLAFCHFFG